MRRNDRTSVSRTEILVPVAHWTTQKICHRSKRHGLGRRLRWREAFRKKEIDPNTAERGTITYIDKDGRKGQIRNVAIKLL